MNEESLSNSLDDGGIALYRHMTLSDQSPTCLSSKGVNWDAIGIEVGQDFLTEAEAGHNPRQSFRCPASRASAALGRWVEDCALDIGRP